MSLTLQQEHFGYDQIFLAAPQDDHATFAELSFLLRGRIADVALANGGYIHVKAREIEFLQCPSGGT